MKMMVNNQWLLLNRIEQRNNFFQKLTMFEVSKDKLLIGFYLTRKHDYVS